MSERCSIQQFANFFVCRLCEILIPCSDCAQIFPPLAAHHFVHCIGIIQDEGQAFGSGRHAFNMQWRAFIRIRSYGGWDGSKVCERSPTRWETSP